MLVFLIGLPGSGKTTLGKQLAKELNYTFVDLDSEIVKKAGQSIEDIFAQHGEGEFRKLEKEALRSLPKESPMVVSTGGGAPCFHDNMTWMNENGITLFLNPPISELAKRLCASNNGHRPMLKQLSSEETLSFLEHKLKERQTFYQKAQLRIDKASPYVGDLKNALLSYTL